MTLVILFRHLLALSVHLAFVSWDMSSIHYCTLSQTNRATLFQEMSIMPFIQKGKCPALVIWIEQCCSCSRNVAFKKLYAEG